MKVVLLRTNKVDPDPRVEKEINSINKINGLNPFIIAWDRTARYKEHRDLLHLESGDISIIRFGIPASWGGGMRKNLKAVVRFNLKLFIWLMKHHKDYDAVHACDIVTALPAIIPIKLFKKKFVYDIFDFYADTQSGSQWILNLLRKIEIKIIERADVTIICSEEREKQIAPARPRELAIVHNSPSQNQLYNGVHSEQICKSQSDRPKVVYVGNLVDDRCIKMMVRAISEIPEAELHIGGFGVLESWVQEAAAKYSNIFYYGKMQYERVLALENECDIMLALYDPAVPNHKYAAPNKFYEALGLGKPLIMFHNTGMDRIVEQYHIGITIDKTPEEVKRAVRSLIVQRNEWTTMSAKMKELFTLRYCWEIMEDKLLQIYTEWI